MTQNRDAPAYQEYAAAMMSRLEYRLMTLEARGLMDTMRRECWVNKLLPSDPPSLAMILGLDEDDIARLLPKVMPFFHLAGEWILCPELDNYRAHLESRKIKQSEGGKAGAAITNGGKKKRRARVSPDVPGKPSGDSSGDSQGTRRGQVESLVQYSSVQYSKEKSSDQGVDLSTPAWVDDEYISEEC